MDQTAAIQLAERQHGVVSVRQLRDLGLGGQHVARLRSGPGWQPLSSQVLRRTGSPDTPAQRVSAAVSDVGPGAVLSHASAAAWWGHRGSSLESPIHVATTRTTKRRSPLASVHRVRSLPAVWVTELDGVPAARPELVALHMFALHRPERAERIVDSLWGQRLLSGTSIASLLDDIGRRGRNGTAGLRVYLEQRGVDYTPPQSGLESRVDQILRSAGIHMRRQVDLGGEGHWSARVDFLHPDLPVVLEVQSALHHSALTDTRADERRLESLRCDGFVVAEVTDDAVWTDPASVVRLVRDAIALARSPRSVSRI